MANESNLKPVRSKSEARERGKNGGKKSGEARRKKKTMRERLELLLQMEREGMDAADAVTIALIEKALTGDVRAYEVIRDTLGEKPLEKIKTEQTGSIKIIWQEQQ